MNHSIRQVSRGLLVAFALVALALGYWGLLRREELVAREDNVRRILDEERIRRGQIVDRNGVLLVESQIEEASGAAWAATIRHTYYPETAPVTGYYSVQYGVGGIEAAYDALLRGDERLTPSELFFNDLLHRPQTGGDVMLTVDLRVQQAATQALNGHSGAVVVLNVPAGEILALTGYPTFDPNTLNENWDDLTDDPGAPLFNRATQGQYLPGTALQPVILGTALDYQTVDLEGLWLDVTAVTLDDEGVLPCQRYPEVFLTMQMAFLYGCPAPFQQIAAGLGEHRLEAAFESFRLYESPPLVLPAEAVEGAEIHKFNLPDESIGQGNLMVSPLQMARVAAAFANHGQMPPLQLVLATRQPDEDWQSLPAQDNPRGVISREHADQIGDLMRLSVENGGAQAARISGEQIRGHAGLAVAGKNNKINGWFIGFVYLPDGSAVAVAVLVEDVADVDLAARIGGEVLGAVVEIYR